MVQSVAYLFDQFFYVYRLNQIVKGSKLTALLRRAESCQENHLNVRVTGFDALENLQAPNSRHQNVKYDNLGRKDFDDTKSLFPTSGFIYGNSSSTQSFCEGGTKLLFIVN